MTTDVPKILRRLAALKRIAVDQEGTPEGDNAERMVVSLLETCPLNLADDALDLHEQAVTRVHDWEGDLIRIIGGIAQVDVQIDNKITVRGIRVAVEEAVRLYEKHRTMLEGMTAYAVLGYLFGAFDSGQVLDYLNDTTEKSKTVEAGKGHTNPVDNDGPTELEIALMRSAKAVAADDPITCWEGLTNTDQDRSEARVRS
jgi:hypothetical protein